MNEPISGLPDAVLQFVDHYDIDPYAGVSTDSGSIAWAIELTGARDVTATLCHVDDVDGCETTFDAQYPTGQVRGFVRPGTFRFQFIQQAMILTEPSQMLCFEMAGADGLGDIGIGMDPDGEMTLAVISLPPPGVDTDAPTDSRPEYSD